MLIYDANLAKSAHVPSASTHRALLMQYQVRHLSRHCVRYCGLSPVWCQVITWTNWIIRNQIQRKSDKKKKKKKKEFYSKKINLKFFLQNGSHFVQAWMWLKYLLATMYCRFCYDMRHQRPLFLVIWSAFSVTILSWGKHQIVMFLFW